LKKIKQFVKRINIDDKNAKTVRFRTVTVRFRTLLILKKTWIVCISKQ